MKVGLLPFPRTGCVPYAVPKIAPDVGRREMRKGRGLDIGWFLEANFRAPAMCRGLLALRTWCFKQPEMRRSDRWVLSFEMRPLSPQFTA